MNQVIVLTELPETIQSQISHLFGAAHVRFAHEADLTNSDWAAATVIIGNPDPQNLAKATALKWLQCHSAGVDRYMRAGVLDGSFAVTNAVGAYGHAVAEHMLTMLLMLLKKMPAYGRLQAQGLWQPQGEVQSIAGKTILVVGYGDLGHAFGIRAHALGATIIGVRRAVGEKPDCVSQMVALNDVHTVLPRADVVAMFLPSTPRTIGIADALWFGQMKHGTWFLNAGRGDAVQEDALVAALKDGTLAGAALDVLPKEPLPSTHPLWAMDNVLITPHVAGGFNMAETRNSVFEVILENCNRYVTQKPLMNQYDPKNEKTMFSKSQKEGKNE